MNLRTSQYLQISGNIALMLPIHAELLGSLIITKFVVEAMKRDREEAKANPYMLVIDEFHNFNTKLLAELVTETRKGGLYLIASHQYLAQLEGEQVRKAMLGATGNKIVFQVGIDDAEILARFIDDMSEVDFVGMPKYTAVVHNWYGSTEFRTLDVFPRLKRAKKVKKEAHERFAKRIKDVDRQLEYFYR